MSLKSSGFSLLEVIIALAILGTAVVSVFQLFSVSLRSTRKAEDYTMALVYARSIIEEAYSVPDPSRQSVNIKFKEGFRGSREVSLKESSEDGSLKVYEITASVSWPPSGNLRIKCLRSVYDPEK